MTDAAARPSSAGSGGEGGGGEGGGGKGGGGDVNGGDGGGGDGGKTGRTRGRAGGGSGTMTQPRSRTPQVQGAETCSIRASKGEEPAR